MVQSYIHIWVLDEEGYWIQAQQNVITVSQRDMVILKGEKCEGLYKLKEGNSVRRKVSGISLKGSSSRGKASRNSAMGRDTGQSVTGKKKGAFG